MGILERSYEEHIGHWKHGGLVGVLGYGGGVIGRYSDLPEEFPECAEFHTLRVNQPAGWFYTSDALRTLADIWDEHGSGLTNMHGSTGDIILLGAKTEKLEPTFSAGIPEALFDPRERNRQGQQYDVTPDGLRFLVNQPLEQSVVEPLTLVQSWARELER